MKQCTVFTNEVGRLVLLTMYTVMYSRAHLNTQQQNTIQYDGHLVYAAPLAYYDKRYICTTTTHTTTILRPFFRDHPGEPVLEENFWTLWCKGRLTEADTPTIQRGATPSGLTSVYHHPPIFYRSNALPAAQPTVSKH